MKEDITLSCQQPIRDDLVAGTYLNKVLKPECFDFTQAECYYFGNPIKFAVAFSDFRECNNGMQAEISIAGRGFKFNKAMIKTLVALFFENTCYNGYRLIALVDPENKQAIRLAKLCGGILEGRLRKVDKNRDRLLFSILKEEYYGKYI